jgi:dienelactone hydrolase
MGRCIINYYLESSEMICESRKPEIWIMGFSACGASALLTVWVYPEVTKVLIINPFLNLEVIKKDLKEYLPLYKGDLFVIIDEKDAVIDPDTVGLIRASAVGAMNIRFDIISNCDHQLKGEINVKILSEHQKYYFDKKYLENQFPNRSGGFCSLNN